MVAREVPARHIGYSFCVNTDESTGVKSLGGHFVVLVALCGVGCTQDVNFCFRAVDDFPDSLFGATGLNYVIKCLLL